MNCLVYFGASSSSSFGQRSLGYFERLKKHTHTHAKTRSKNCLIIFRSDCNLINRLINQGELCATRSIWITVPFHSIAEAENTSSSFGVRTMKVLSESRGKPNSSERSQLRIKYRRNEKRRKKNGKIGNGRKNGFRVNSTIYIAFHLQFSSPFHPSFDV